MGQFYRHPTLALPPHADRLRIQPLYEALHAAVREIDSEKLIFYESLPINLGKVGFTSLPGSDDKKSVLSWHFYWNPIGKSKFITSRIQEAKRLDVVPFVSEIDISWDGTLRKDLEVYLVVLAYISDEGGIQIQDSLETMKRLDSEITSWLGWEYKTYIKKTGYGEGIFNSITEEQRLKMKTLYSRPFAQAVSGKIELMKYDDNDGDFHLIWTIPPFSSSASTIISTGREYHYPDGLSVTISPNQTSSYTENGNLIYVTTQTRPHPQTIKLIISRK